MSEFVSRYSLLLHDLRVFVEGLREVGLKDDASALEEIVSGAPHIDLAQQPAAKTIVIADCPHCGYTELSEGQRAKLAAELVGQQPAAVDGVADEYSRGYKAGHAAATEYCVGLARERRNA